MVKKLPRVKVNGVEYFACPICGKACSNHCWWTYHHCSDCHTLIKQGHDVDKVRALRGDQQTIQALIKTQVIPTTAALQASNTVLKHDFITTFPKGVTLYVNDVKEAAVLRDTYTDYEHYGENIDEFATVIGGVLQARLEQYRISKRLASADITPVERKNETEMHTKLADQINKSTAALDGMKSSRATQGVNILTEEFAKMATYMAEHQHEYQGIGICPDCKQRIIFTTCFPTFKARYEEILRSTIAQLTESGSYDMTVANELVSRMQTELNDDTIADTYAVKHKRQFEISLP